MQIFVYEWATGGGLVDEPGPLPASLLREGAAMIGALATDLLRIEGCRVTTLRDPRVVQLALGSSEVVDVLSRSMHDEEFERLAATSDATILIAPEFDGILWKAARRATASGGKLLSPSPEFIRIAADKQRTCDVLRAAGVPVPEGRMLESDELLPQEFSYPAVREAGRRSRFARYIFRSRAPRSAARLRLAAKARAVRARTAGKYGDAVRSCRAR